MTQPGEREQLWCTSLIFAHANGQCFILPVAMHQITDYTQDIHYNIPSDWVIHNLSSGYIYCGGWHKPMSNFDSMCCSYPLNLQVLFYDGQVSHFNDRTLQILHRHNIHYFILMAGDYVHNQTNDNGTNMNLNNLYANERMNWMRHHGTLKFTPPHMNYVLIEI